MSDVPHALRHQDAAKKTDDALRDEARAHLARSPKLQIVAEVLGKLRALQLPWWSASHLRGSFPCATRMRWFAERVDLRQTITHQLTGLAPKAARALTPDAQAQLIDAVIDAGDIDCVAFEAAFDPRAEVVYGPVTALWKRFRESFPWDTQTKAHQELMCWLIGSLISERSEDGVARKPILTAWDVRTAIDGRVWHTMIPIDVRIAIDEMRLLHEKTAPREAVHARHELELATPEVIASHIPLRELQRIFVTAEKALGFEESAPEIGRRAPSVAPVAPVALSPTSNRTLTTGEPPPRESFIGTRAGPPPGHRVALDVQPTPCMIEEVVIDDNLFADVDVGT